MRTYPHLFNPIRIRNTVFRNRFIMAPLTSDNCVVDNHPSQQGIAFYETRARGGFALVTVNEVDVDDEYAKRSDAFNVLYDPNPTYWHSVAFYNLTQAIHQHGAVASIELNHSGAANHPKNIPGHKNPIGPVSYLREDGIAVDGMDEEMMHRVADNFARTAKYAKLVGFDMCMIHGGHGWLLAQFLSPLTNSREDKYGGSRENRARFPLMVIDRVRKAVGDDFLIAYRLSGEERVAGGLTIEDTIDFARRIDGKVDLIDVSVGIYHLHVRSLTFSSLYHPHGCNVGYATAIKRAVDTPVSVVGGINDPEMAERIVADGAADFVALGRQALADPEFPNKALTGRQEEISPCMRCGCFSPMPQVEGAIVPPHTFQCAVNPVTSKEHLLQIAPRPRESRSVLVVGGGPAGMYAAITAAERGHSVILAERSNSLGGLLKFADVDSYKDDLRRFRDSLILRLAKASVDVRLGTEISREAVLSEDPDVLIAAVGSSPVVPAIPGIDGSNVLHATDVYEDQDRIGTSVVIIGGGLVGCETALHLAARGKSVTLIEMLDRLAPDAYESHRIALLEKMEGEVTCRVRTRCTGIEYGGIRVLDSQNRESFIQGDTVVYAVGMKARAEMAYSLCEAASRQYFLVGDCLSPGKVHQAVHEGYHAALDIY